MVMDLKTIMDLPMSTPLDGCGDLKNKFYDFYETLSEEEKKFLHNKDKFFAEMDDTIRTILRELDFALKVSCAPSDITSEQAREILLNELMRK